MDASQRVSLHTDRDVDELTPKLCKERFAENPFLSDLDLLGKQRRRLNAYVVSDIGGLLHFFWEKPCNSMCRASPIISDLKTGIL